MGFNNWWWDRAVSLACTHESESHNASARQFLCVISHLGEKDRVTWLKPCLAPHRQHMSTTFWGLVSSQKVLMELCFGICTCRQSCLRDGECQGGKREGRDLFEYQAAERRHSVHWENSCFSPLILPHWNTHTHTQMQTHIVSFSPRDVLCECLS